MSNPEPSVQDLSPVVPKGMEKEPVVLIDTSGSMSYPAAPSSPIRRMDVVGEAMGGLVARLAAQDSQAEKEAAAGEDKGGLMTILFGPSARELGDMNEGNWRRLWEGIQWGGGTHILPGWGMVVDNFMQEFGDIPQMDRPALLLLVITDGEAADMEQFEAECLKAGKSTYICVAVIGFGPEHDATVAAYQQLAQKNPHVRVVTFGSQTDPDTIAEGLTSLMS